jgi:hypothetical protein
MRMAVLESNRFLSLRACPWRINVLLPWSASW